MAKKNNNTRRQRLSINKSNVIQGNPFDLDALSQQSQQIEIAKQIALEKAFQSNDIGAIMKAQNYLKKIEKKEEVDYKSMLVDPMDLSSSFGYKHKPFNISYEVLRAMGRTHIVKSIIETRKDQVSEFCTPRDNKNGIGFVIQKKKGYLYKPDAKPVKLTKGEEERIEQIIDFLMNCGSINNKWRADDFDSFSRKIISDSLTIDQATFEIPRDKGGRIIEFLATDAATFRIADSYEEDQNQNEVLINGHAPSYVQLYNQNIISEFYPWEMCFGTRNPSTNIHTNGYGRSELEDMIQTVTAILNADTYNANFFKVGSAPKGILKYSGNINPNTVEDFRRQWTAQVSGVMNMHKIPMINADKMEFINTGQNNKDMEFSKYQEFLLKITCAIYKMDPAEIGFPMQGTSEASGLGGDGGTKSKIQYSRSKGLKPLLRKYEKWINKYLVSELDPGYEFKFVGIDDADDEDQELERDIKAVSSIMTLNEVRAKRNLPPVENGDVVLNPTYLQAIGMAQQGNEESNQAVDNMNGGDQNPFEQSDEEENPFMKSLQDELGTLLNQDLWNHN